MKKSLINILEYKVSFQSSARANLSKELTIKESLELIKSAQYKPKIEFLRSLLNNGKKDEYNKHKISLPAVTFCGTFNKKRRRDDIKYYNPIIVIDIDKLESKELVETIELLKKDPFVFSLWKSPSNKGIKGLVSLKYNFKINQDEIDFVHKSAFTKLADYFIEKYNIELDKSGSDTTRLCFFSFDNSLILKDNFEYFNIFNTDIKQVEKRKKKKTPTLKHVSNKDALYNPKGKNSQKDRKTISSVLRYLEKKDTSINNSFKDWLKVAMAIANSFTYDIGEKYFLRFSALDKEKYNEINTKNFLKECYLNRNGSIKFNSIIHLSNKKGYLTSNQRKKGSETEV